MGVIRLACHQRNDPTIREIFMSRKRSSIIGKLGWGLAGDMLLFCTALLFMSIFAFTSLSNAYLISLPVLAVVIAFIVYRKSRKKADG